MIRLNDMANLRFGNLYCGGVYHIFNRGVDKRIIFDDVRDKERFLSILDLLNTSKVINSVSNLKKGDINKKQEHNSKTSLVNVIAYTLQGNHFHLLLEQVAEEGVSKFMHKISTAYTNYYNEKNERSGSLFQGKYKFIEAKNDNHVLRLICYINSNELLHGKQQNKKEKYSSREWYISGSGPSYVQRWSNMIGDYEKIEQEVIEQTKRQRSIDKDMDDIL